jgi:hypothetical protein
VTVLKRVVPVAACLLAATPAALADGTVRLDAGRAASSAVVAMGLDGRAAALYPRLGTLRLVLAIPDAAGVARGGVPENAPIARGAVVEGMVVDAAGSVIVLTRSKNECSELSLAVRDPAGTWSTVPLSGPPARAATLAADPAGIPGLVAVGCAGEVALRRPDATGAWPAEPVPATAAPTARPTVALGASGVVVAALDGDRPLILSRSTAGIWTPLTLPERPLVFGERVVTFGVVVDGAGAPVVAMTRAGPLSPGVGSSEPLAVTRRLDRLSAGVWQPVQAGDVSAIDVRGLGDTWVARRRDGTLLVVAATATATLPIDAVAVAAAPGGRVAYIPRGAPSVLGFGAPPRLTVTGARGVRFGEPTALRVTLTAPAGGPVPGARVRTAGLSGVTDTQGRLVLRPVMTKTASVDVVSVEPGPFAPVRASRKIVVRPQSVTLTAQLVENETRATVSGLARGGAPLKGPLGRVYLLNMRTPGRGFLPGGVVASAPGGRAFSFPAVRSPKARLGLFFKGSLVRLR